MMICRIAAGILFSILLAACVSNYPVVAESKSASFIKFERDVASPILGSSTFYVKVDEEQNCHEAFSDQLLLAGLDKGNPLITDLNVDGLYVNPEDDFRILIRTVAGSAWCDVFAKLNVVPGQRYKIIASGDAGIHANRCSAKLYRFVDDKDFVEEEFKEYFECNK